MFNWTSYQFAREILLFFGLKIIVAPIYKAKLKKQHGEFNAAMENNFSDVSVLGFFASPEPLRPVEIFNAQNYVFTAGTYISIKNFRADYKKTFGKPAPGRVGQLYKTTANGGR